MGRVALRGKYSSEPALNRMLELEEIEREEDEGDEGVEERRILGEDLKDVNGRNDRDCKADLFREEVNDIRAAQSV